MNTPDTNTNTAAPYKLMKKSRPIDNPYEIWRAGTWEWCVLKYYGNPDKPFARALCAVSSPHTFGSHDIGDVYVCDIRSHARLEQTNYPTT